MRNKLNSFTYFVGLWET